MTLSGKGEHRVKIIVVDVQKGIANERLYDFNGFIKNISQILDTAR